MGSLKKLWDYDFRDLRLDQRPRAQRIGLVVVTLLMGALVFQVGPFLDPARVLVQAITGDVSLFGGALSVRGAYALLVLLSCAVMASTGYGWYRALFGPHSREASPVVWANGLVVLVDIGVTTVLVLAAGAIYRISHASPDSLYRTGRDALNYLPGRWAALMNHVLPGYALPWHLSALAGYLTIGLAFYAFHRLCHTSRVFWLLVHRPHHVPTVLVGLHGAVAIFYVVSYYPRFLLGSVLGALLPAHEAQPTVGFLIALVSSAGDLVAHQTVMYRACYRNPVLRFFSHLSAGGPYHYVHHSSRSTEQMVNLDALGPFLLWDRIFGTYRAPTDVIPPVGLTNDPEIRHNPLRVVFSGYQQIAFELRMNKSWRTRAHILFGSVTYKPPVTREFLMLEKPATAPAAAPAEALPAVHTGYAA